MSNEISNKINEVKQMSDEDLKKTAHEVIETTLYLQITKHAETCTPCRLIITTAQYIVEEHLKELNKLT